MLSVTGKVCLGSGAECRVYPSVEGMVLKLYYTEEERDSAWNRQKAACSNGFAPPVGRAADNVEGDRCKFKYGYFSCKAQVDVNMSSYSLNKARGALIPKAESMGMSTIDICPRNIGKWKGVWVVIDFGDLSST